MTRKILQEIIFIVVRVAFVVALIYAGYSCISSCYDFGYRIFADKAKDPAPGIVKTVAIVDGKTDKEIGEILEEKGLIDDGFLFGIQVKFSEYRDKLKPGVYELSTAMSPYDMMAVMSATVEEESEGDEEETVISTKSEANLWDEADDTVKDEEENKSEDGN
ncbi:MAG: endolytic transglycosylase MltG [Lachnospiraceae bacterium]|nr:endolytic transglycosylase MltG [Lachnospiraceae bacterium]